MDGRQREIRLLHSRVSTFNTMQAKGWLPLRVCLLLVCAQRFHDRARVRLIALEAGLASGVAITGWNMFRFNK